MSILKEINLFTSLLKARIQNRRVPLIVTILITRRCNLRCAYCFVVQSKEEEMDTTQCKKMIDEFARSGMKQFIISGGEPLIRDDIGDIVNFASSQGITVWLNSNGFFVPARVKSLKKVDKLLLSLDGDEQTHDTQRGPGSYKKVISAIEAAKSHKIPVNVGMVVTSKNIDKLHEYFNLLSFYKIEGRINILFERMSRTSDNQVISCVKGKKEDIKMLIHKLLEYKRKGYPIIYSTNTLKHCLNWKDYDKEWLEEPPNFKYPKCYAGKLYCFVNSNGDLLPCCLRNSTAGITNGVKLGFKKAFDLMLPPKCITCYTLPYTNLNLICHLDVISILELAKSSFSFKYR